jgi:hypothetical protein
VPISDADARSQVAGAASYSYFKSQLLTNVKSGRRSDHQVVTSVPCWADSARSPTKIKGSWFVMKPARLPIGNASAWSEGASDISTASRDCSRLEADVLATPDWLKIRKGFEAHSIYSIDMSPVGTQWGCTDAGCLARACARIIAGIKCHSGTLLHRKGSRFPANSIANPCVLFFPAGRVFQAVSQRRVRS